MIKSLKIYFSKIPLDALGMCASLLCAIHCASLPLLLSLSTLAGLHFLGNPWIEYSVVFFSLVIALISFIPAYRNHHHKLSPVMILGLGFVFIAMGQIELIPKSEIIMTVIGAVFISIAHLINWRLIIKFK